MTFESKYIHKIAFENSVHKMAAIFLNLQYVYRLLCNLHS